MELVKGYPEGIDVKEEVQRFIESTGINVSKNGYEFVFESCPFCGGGTKKDKKTFSINYLNGQYQCKRGKCGETGNLWTLTKDERFSYALPDPEEKEVRKHTYLFKNQKVDDQKAAEWVLANRGIPKEITEKYNLAFGGDGFKKILNTEGNMVVAKPQNVLVWRFTDPYGKGALWFKFRKTEGSGPKEWSISKDFIYNGNSYHAEPCLYGMGECDYKEPFVIMTEGQFDTLAVAAAGYGNVVSVPTGMGGMKWFDENTVSRDFLARFDILIVFGDREKDGNITLLDDMQQRFNGIVKVVRGEDYIDCKDANEILQKYGTEQIRKCVENAQSIPIKGLKRPRDIKRVNMSSLQRIRTGLPSLDKSLQGFFFGQVVTITGRSGDGKTTLAMQMVTHALNQNIPTVVYSGEFTDWMIKNWIVLQLAGPHNLINKEPTKETWDKIEAWEPYSEHFWVYDEDVEVDEDIAKCDFMLETIRKAILSEGVKLVVIDNLMTAIDIGDDGDLNKVQSIFMKKLKKMALTYEVIVMLIAHPKKAAAYTKKNIINKEDIAGSSNIGNLSDTIISYSKPDEPDKVDHQREIIILKNRWNNDTGVGEVIRTYFNDASKRIAESKDFDWALGWEPQDRLIEYEQESLPWEEE